MKKITLSIIAIVMALTCVFGFSACGQTPEQKLESYIESDSVKEQIDEQLSAFESLLDVDVRAEGTKVIYDFTYKNQISDSEFDTIKENIDSSQSLLATTYESFANKIKNELGINDVSIVINYNNADGTKITSMEFHAAK